MPTTTAVRTRTVPLEALTADELRRWADLADEALEPNPYVHPAFLHTAARWMPNAKGIQLVVVEADDRWLALLPLSVEPRFQRLRLPYATTAGPFLSKRAPLCVPLVDRTAPHAALEGLLGHLSDKRSGLPGLLELTLFPGEGPLLTALQDVAQAAGIPLHERYRFERACMRRTEDAQDWRQTLSASRRKTIGRLRRGLEREVGAPIVMSDRGHDPQAFEDFLDLEAAGWKGRKEKGGGALRITPNAVEWFTEVTAGFRERDGLRILTMTAADTVLYMSLSFENRKHVFSLMDTYNEEYARFSPGTVGRAEELDAYFHDADGPELFDPCMHPKNVQSTALYPHRRPLVGLLLAPRGLLNRALVRGIPRLAAAKDLAQSVRDRVRRKQDPATAAAGAIPAEPTASSAAG